MGAVNLDQVEVTLLSKCKKRVKRFNGDVQDAQTFSKICRVTLSDGTQYFAELRLVPSDFFPLGPDADGVVFEHFFLEAYDVGNDGQGSVVHEKRGHI